MPVYLSRDISIKFDSMLLGLVEWSSMTICCLE